MQQNSNTFRVLLPLPLQDGYDYLPLADQLVKEGDLVEVPFGNKTSLGVVFGPGDGKISPEKLKRIQKIIPLPTMPKESLEFVNWVSQYTLTPKGSVLKMVLGSTRLIHSKKNDASAPKPPIYQYINPTLNEEQRVAAENLTNKVKAQSFSVTLLDGVTGSGKTEVFGEAIAQCLRQQKQALVLLPEIAMTATLLDRFEKRFGAKPTEWHSGLSDKQRRLNLHAIMKGEAQFILGARSALFLPYSKLGLIVVDEEHEAAFKQEEGVIYHGRDLAVVRARIGNIPIILSSATPSLETSYNVQIHKYDQVVLRQRYGQALMPIIELVDLRQLKMKATDFISPPLLTALKSVIAKKQQAMIFLNRRGYAPLTLCRACGHRLQCPRCTSWLIEHKQTAKLHCHHCNYSISIPKQCPSCSVEGKLAACGPGIERIADEIKKLIPEIRMALMSSDNLTSPQAVQSLLDQMDQGHLDLLIGTQIMAKGYHFPKLTLVGIIDADMGLGGGDPRAAERTFQLLQQVAGRSGRSDDKGSVLIQTTSPEHPVIQALLKGDRDGFMSAELKEREAYHLPPVWRLAHVTVTGKDLKNVIHQAEVLAAAAPQNKDLRVLGPAPAPFVLLRGRYRYRLLIQTSRNHNLSSIIRSWLVGIAVNKSVRVQVDIDPYSFL